MSRQDATAMATLDVIVPDIVRTQIHCARSVGPVCYNDSGFPCGHRYGSYDQSCIIDSRDHTAATSSALGSSAARSATIHAPIGELPFSRLHREQQITTLLRFNVPPYTRGITA